MSWSGGPLRAAPCAENESTGLSLLVIFWFLFLTIFFPILAVRAFTVVTRVGGWRSFRLGGRDTWPGRLATVPASSGVGRDKLPTNAS